MDKVDLYFTREKYRNDFHLFCDEVLGYKDFNEIHKDELLPLVTSDSKNKLILMSRYSFKSCVCTVAYSLWRLAKNYDLRILIYSDAASKAETFLLDIKNHIEGKVGKSRFREIFGAWEVDSKKEPYNLSRIVIAFRQNASKEPSIDTAGQDTSKIAYHYDIIIFDDIVSDLNTTTKAQMDKTANCYKKALSLLIPGGEIIIVGTRWHFGDLYGRIIAENKKTNYFKIIIKDAEEKNKKEELIFADIGLTREFLDNQKSKQGTYLYSCLYRNNPVDDDSAIFKERDFEFYGGIKPDDLYITGILDPAGEGKDKNGLTVVGTDYQMVMNILKAIAADWTPSEIIDNIIKIHYEVRFKIFGLETIFFRNMLKTELERRIRIEHENNPTKFPLFHIEEFDSASRHGKSKFTRIMGLQPYHERGAIRFPGEKFELLEDGFSDLAHQMLEFTPSHMPEPNDLIDSLADHIPLIRKGGVAKQKEVPYMSPAWIELEAMKEEIKVRNRLPRRIRGYLAPLSLS